MGKPRRSLGTSAVFELAISQLARRSVSPYPRHWALQATADEESAAF
jgi:hypothetical protein